MFFCFVSDDDKSSFTVLFLCFMDVLVECLTSFGQALQTYFMFIFTVKVPGESITTLSVNLHKYIFNQNVDVGGVNLFLDLVNLHK